MRIEFESIDEVLAFAGRLQAPAAEVKKAPEVKPVQEVEKAPAEEKRLQKRRLPSREYRSRMSG